MKETTPDFLVDVRCFTYNQSRYITDAMNGFCMQQTDFPFICCIVDDASTDGEQEVIDEYIKEHFDFSVGSEAYKEETDYGFITYARHKTNRNCYFYVICLKENHYRNPHKYQGKNAYYLKRWRDICKYEAMCEGDDYWVDPLKLQKQVNFLNMNTDYVMCFTNFDFYYQNEKRTEYSILTNQSDRFPHKFTIEEWIQAKTYVGPMSWVYRTSCLSQIPKLNGPDGTFVWFAFFIATSKVKCLIDDTTSVYRINDGGVTQSKSLKLWYERQVGMFNLQKQLLDLFVSERCREVILRKLKVDFYNNSYKAILLCGSKEQKKDLDDNKSLLCPLKRILYLFYSVSGTYLNKLYGYYMGNKGFKE